MNLRTRNKITQRAIFTIIALCFLNTSYGQKTEFRISLNSGLFSFAGKSAESVTSINYSEWLERGYTNNPYGSRGGLGIGLSGNLKRLSTNNSIIGIDLGYELLRSKIKINHVSGSTGSSTYELSAKGKTFLNSNFINLHPFMGYRLPVNNLNIDFTGGLDIAYCISSKENGSATASDGTKYETAVDRENINFDIRPRIQIAANYEKVGVYIGYSLGLADYKANYDGGKIDKCYASLLRFGLTYQLK